MIQRNLSETFTYLFIIILIKNIGVALHGDNHMFFFLLGSTLSAQAYYPFIIG
jgi:hypothetical protein